MLTAVGAWVGPAPATEGAEPTVDRLTFTPVADTYVDSSSPTTAYGLSIFLKVDAKSVKRTFLKFNVAGLNGREVLDVRLRLHSVADSPSGGRIFSVASTSWTESMTYSDQPPVDGPQLGELSGVVTDGDYEAGLGTVAVTNDGLVSFALDSLDLTEARWASRKAADPPVLVVDVPHVPGTYGDGISAVSTALNGAADPTYQSMNKHLAVTQNGRLLAVHGQHKTGVVLAWRDPGSGWQNVTTGAATNGVLLGGTGTGGWPASIVTAVDPTGAEHAWAVWATPNTGSDANDIRPLRARRLSDLDAATGPSVGPLIDIAPGGVGNHRADLAVENTPDGGKRVAVVWERMTGTGSFQLMVAYLTDLTVENPAVSGPFVLASGTSPGLMGTIVTTADGLQIVARMPNGRLGVLRHEGGSPLDQWTSSSPGIIVSTTSYPTATPLSSTGELVAAVESDVIGHTVSVQRFSADGTPQPVEASFTGYKQPSIATDATRMWLVMVRVSDGNVVSRVYTPTSGWSGADRVELGPEGGGNYAWPNAVRQTVGRLRFLVRGPAGSAYQSQTLFVQRRLEAGEGDPPPPPPPHLNVVGVSTTDSGSTQKSTTSVTIDAPQGVQAGHVMYAWISLRSLITGGLTAPSGWTLVQHPVETAGEGYLYRAVYGEDVNGAAWTWGGGAVSNKWAAGIVALSGVDGLIESASAPEVATARALHSSPPITTSENSFVLGFAGDRLTDGSTWSWPEGWTERYDRASTGINAVSGSVATLDADPAAPGSFVATSTASGASNQAWMAVVAIRPPPPVAE